MQTQVKELSTRSPVPEFPKLMKDETTGNIYLMSAPASGTRIAAPSKQGKVGIHKSDFTIDPRIKLMEFVGTVTLNSE